jgi:hypothetical protein
MKTLMIDVANHCYKFLLELFVTRRGEDLIDILERAQPLGCIGRDT